MVYENLLNIKLTALEYCKRLWQLAHAKVGLSVNLLAQPRTDFCTLRHHPAQSGQRVQKNSQLLKGAYSAPAREPAYLPVPRPQPLPHLR